jgi:hypothetical protein
MVMTVGFTKRLLAHPKEASGFPHRRPGLHQPCRRCMSESVVREMPHAHRHLGGHSVHLCTKLALRGMLG